MSLTTEIILWFALGYGLFTLRGIEQRLSQIYAEMLYLRELSEQGKDT